MTNAMTEFYQQDLAQQSSLLGELAAEALRQWRIEFSALELIKYRENAVFKVIKTDGSQVALRIHRAHYHSDAELRSELQWMAELGRAGIDVPQVIPTPQGELFKVIGVDSIPEPRQVDIFVWIDGNQLGSVDGGFNGDPKTIRDTYHTIGEIAAKLHNQATHWILPPGFERHNWDYEGLVGEAPLWGRFWELAALTDEQRQLILTAREKLRSELAAYGKPEGLYSMIHADFVPENLLVEDSHVRLIDFDDAGFGWHLFELATALYFVLGEPYYETAFEALISGYRKHRPLADEQLQHMQMFYVARGFTYLGWVHTRYETQTARELTPMLVDALCTQAKKYLA